MECVIQNTSNALKNKGSKRVFAMIEGSFLVPYIETVLERTIFLLEHYNMNPFPL